MKVSGTYLITGANSGLGFHTALHIAKLGGEVIMVCRDSEKGTIAREEITRSSGSKAIHLYIADLSSQSQIRQLAGAVRSAFSKIDVLINNAACNFLHFTQTENGIEMQFAVNHLAPFLLTHLLLDKLRNAEQGRIINVTSRAHARGSLHFEDLNLSNNYSAFAAYNQSKLANILFTYELAKRLQDTSITVNCFHPGLVDTPIGNKNTTWFYSVLWSMIKMFGASPSKSAETGVYLATSDAVKNVNGKYFANCKEIKSSAITYNQKIASQLWQVSEEMTGIKRYNEI